MSRSSRSLSEKEIAVLAFIKATRKESGRPPTLKEISRHMSWAAHSTAWGVVDRLSKKGVISKEKWGRIEKKKNPISLKLLGEDESLIIGGAAQ